MTEKYIDLASRISNESGAYHLRDTIIEGVLEWLDEHPDQVPGRTITESEAWDIAGRTFHRWGSVEELASHLRGTFRQLGITVVPDPEPTIPLPTEPGAQFIAYSSKLSEDPEDQREFVIAGKYVVALDSAAVYSRELFEDAGWVVTSLVTAPGGDDDH